MRPPLLKGTVEGSVEIIRYKIVASLLFQFANYEKHVKC
jgi:hypothetical protein